MTDNNLVVSVCSKSRLLGPHGIYFPSRLSIDLDAFLQAHEVDYLPGSH